jgi:uncharacterized protein YjiS (DUF1127 family)
MPLQIKDPAVPKVSLSLDTAASASDVVDVVRGGWTLMLIWRARASQRRALAELDDRWLRDVGLTRGDAQREVRKPFWRA